MQDNCDRIIIKTFSALRVFWNVALCSVGVCGCIAVDLIRRIGRYLHNIVLIKRCECVFGNLIKINHSHSDTINQS